MGSDINGAAREFDGGSDWGGPLTVGPLYTTSGRLLIGVTNSSGHEFAITVSRWISERRAGRIVPAQKFGIIHNGLPAFFDALALAVGHDIAKARQGGGA